MKKIKALLYCCKAKPYIMKYKDGKYKEIASFYNKQDLIDCELLNGKIVAECDFEVEEITYAPNPSAFERANISPKEWGYDYQEKYGGLSNEELLKHSCLTNEELSDYLNTPTNEKKVFCKDTFGYAIHIKNLHIFDEPRELSDYHISYFNEEFNMMREKHIEKAPKNMCRAFDIKDTYILISIRPERLCKILNGEKTIEVKKQVLNCMKGND